MKHGDTWWSWVCAAWAIAALQKGALALLGAWFQDADFMWHVRGPATSDPALARPFECSPPHPVSLAQLVAKGVNVPIPSHTDSSLYVIYIRSLWELGGAHHPLKSLKSNWQGSRMGPRHVEHMAVSCTEKGCGLAPLTWLQHAIQWGRPNQHPAPQAGEG